MSRRDPKFKIGDYLVHQNQLNLIFKVVHNQMADFPGFYELLSLDRYGGTSNRFHNYDKVENKCRLATPAEIVLYAKI